MISSPDLWTTKPDNWTGPDPYIYFSFESDSHLNLTGGTEITSDGRVCTFMSTVYLHPFSKHKNHIRKKPVNLFSSIMCLNEIIMVSLNEYLYLFRLVPV